MLKQLLPIFLPLAKKCANLKICVICFTFQNVFLFSEWHPFSRGRRLRPGQWDQHHHKYQQQHTHSPQYLPCNSGSYLFKSVDQSLKLLAIELSTYLVAMVRHLNFPNSAGKSLKL